MQHVKDALAAGAAGFVPKAAIADEVVRAIETAAAGSCYVHPSISTKLIQQLGRAGRGTDAVSELSVREREILRLLAVGYTNKEVAHQLGISVKTVETYKARAGEKLGLRSRVDLMNFAISHRWLGAPVVPA
jgi:DNA-binding NarL/FixJ family response regulator